jgi:peptide chain release factor subunit 1
MINETTLRDLIGFHPGTPVLSVYLDVDPISGASEKSKLRLRQMLQPYEDEAFDDVHRVQRYMEHEYDGAGRAVVLFSCVDAEFFEAFILSLPIRSRARLLNRPYVKPLAALLETYGHIGVALVDQQGARLFHFHLGQLSEQEGTLGESVRHTKHGGGTQVRGSRGGSSGQTRSAEGAIERNVRDAAHFASDFFSQQKIRRVLVGGTDEIAARFISHLRRQWQSLVMGRFSIEMTAGHAAVMERSLEILEEWDHQKDARLISTIVTAAAKGGNGVVRLDDTLSAVHAGNVQTLIISDGYRAPGYRCTHCAYLSSQPQEQCGFCGNPVEEIEDAVEFAVRRVLADGGEVEVVKANPQLEKAGNIGALLRY